MDFSQLSDEELEAMVMGGGQSAPPRQPQGGLDFGSMSDEELEALASGQAPQQAQFDVPQETAQPPGPSRAQTALESAGKGATLGYLAQLQAMAEPLTDRAFNLIPGMSAEPTPMRQMNPGSQEYVQARDRNIKRQRAQATAHPGTAFAGEMGGILATSAIPAGAIGAAGRLAGRGAQAVGLGAKLGSTTGKIAAGAAQGAGFGAVINPGDVEGEVNPLQLDERMSNAQMGAAFGGGLRAAGAGLQKAAPKMKQAAEQLAFKSGGAMLREFRRLAPKGDVNKIGRFMLDKKIVTPGARLGVIEQRAESVRQQAGKALDNVYSKSKDAMGDALNIPKKLQGLKPSQFATMKKGNLGKRWQNMTPREFSEVRNVGFNPARDKQKLLSSVNKDLGDMVGKDSAIDQVQKYLDQLVKTHGNKIFDPKSANNIKGAIDKKISWARDPRNNVPEAEAAFRSLRTAIQKRIEKQVNFLGKHVGDDGLKQSLKKANQEYGYAQEILRTSKDKLNREGANQIFGMSEKLSGIGGAATGSAMGGPAAIALGALGVVGSKLARTYGTSTAAVGLDKLGNMAMRGGAAAKHMANPTLRKMLSPGFAEQDQVTPLNEWQEQQLMLSQEGR
jgi:hypothetical protein